MTSQSVPQFVNGSPVLYALVHAPTDASDRPEDQYYVLCRDGDRVERYGLSDIGVPGEGCMVQLNWTPSFSIKLGDGSSMANRPSLYIAGTPAEPMFDCDLATVRLDVSGDRLEYDTEMCDRLQVSSMVIATFGLIKVFTMEGGTAIYYLHPLDVIRFLDLLENAIVKFQSTRGDRTVSTLAGPVPSYLLNNLQRAVEYYGSRKGARPALTMDDLKRIGPMQVVCTQAVAMANYLTTNLASGDIPETGEVGKDNYVRSR